MNHTTATAPPTHIAIIGAGCAGLSIAVTLLERFPALHTTIIDAKPAFTNDRTWCSFAAPNDPYDFLATHRWQHVTVRGPRSETRCHTPQRRYRHIPADRFYEHTTHLLSHTRRCTIHLNTPARAITPLAHDRIQLRTDDHNLDADYILDSRPPRPDALPTGGLLQHFSGHEVQTQQPAFDPTTATLMDFDVPQTHGPHFVYVLPFSETRALIEPTLMTPTPENPPDYNAAIAEYLRIRCNTTTWRVLRTETGAIPMIPALHRRLANNHPRHWRIGATSGAAKPSTGYAFDAIQRDNANIAAAIARNKPRPRPPRTRTAAWLDRMMVTLIRDHPQLAPHVFPRLFERARTDRLVRFLTDHATQRDTLDVILAAPRARMILHALTSAAGYR